MRDHRPLRPELALEPCWRPVERQLQVVDPLLRLRKSLAMPEHYVLERRVRRGKPSALKVTKNPDTAVQIDDGYVHVATVHPWYLAHVDRILEALKTDGYDLHAEGGAEVAWQDFCRAEQARRVAKWGASRRDPSGRVYEEFNAFYREAFDVMKRMGDPDGRTERFRYNNAGGAVRYNIAPEPPASAGEIPAPERSEVPHAHPHGSTDRRQTDQLRRDPAA